MTPPLSHPLNRGKPSIFERDAIAVTEEKIARSPETGEAIAARPILNRYDLNRLGLLTITMRSLADCHTNSKDAGELEPLTRRGVDIVENGLTLQSEDGEGALILIVDDDRAIRNMLVTVMHNQGYRVATAVNGLEALQVYKESKPDMVLLDAIMPMMDGFDCCLELQRLQGSDRTPVLMITGLEDNDSVDRAFEVGAVDYVTKPIHWAVLRQRVRRLLEQARLYRELEAANQELRRLAFLDGLTRVANRRGFDQTLERHWHELAQSGAYLSLILCDVDCFKRYNDTYGHQAGDRCLQEIARTLRQAASYPTDFVARYGGEEFAVILPRTEAAAALYVAQKIRMGVRHLAIAHESSTVSPFVTLSLGVATMVPYPGTSETQAIAAADKALYQAKQAGRDRAILKILN